MKNQTKTVYLGSLRLAECFHFPRRKTIYLTIDHRPSIANITYGSRWCLNMRTLKAKKIKCNEMVSRGT